MKKFVLFLVGLLCFGLANSTRAATYYVDTNGNDVNSGTAQSSAWRTLDKVNNAALVAGDNVFFNRGQVWRGQLFPKSGSAAGNITYGAYGAGALPTIKGSDFVSGTASWISEGGNIWRRSTTNNDDVGALFFNGNNTAGFKKWFATDLKAQGDFWYDRTNKVLKLYSTSSPGTAYSGIEASLTRNIVPIGANSYITIENMALQYGAAHGVQGSGASNITISKCEISYIGGGYLSESNGTFTRFGNGVEWWAGAVNCRVEKCKIWEIFDTGVTNQYTGTSTQQYIYYQNNLIWNCGLATYECWLGGGVLNNISFENNTCLNAGRGWGGKNTAQRGFNGDASGKIGAQLAFLGSVPTPESFYVINNIFYQSEDMYIFALKQFTGWDNVIFDGNDWVETTNPSAQKLYVMYDNATGQVPASYSMADFATYQTQTGRDPRSIKSDPSFVNVGANDFHLNANSPCIDKGIANGLPSDFESRARPVGSAIDIGAFEYASTGSGNAITKVRSFPRSGFAYRMNGGKFQGSNDASFASGVVTLATLNASPADNVWSEVAVSDTGTYRYLRFLSPNGGYGDVSEVEFYRGTTKVTGTVIGTLGAYNNGTTTRDKAFDGNTSTFFDAAGADGNWTGLDTGGGSATPTPTPSATPGANLVTNPGFEADNAATQTPSGWSESGSNVAASFTETNGGNHSGSFHGAHWSNTGDYTAYTYQTKTGLANGLYTLKAWVKSSGGHRACYLEAKDFGGTARTAGLPTTNTWTQITISDISVTNGQCTIGVWSNATGGLWCNFDDFEFFKQ